MATDNSMLQNNEDMFYVWMRKAILNDPDRSGFVYLYDKNVNVLYRWQSAKLKFEKEKQFLVIPTLSIEDLKLMKRNFVESVVEDMVQTELLKEIEEIKSINEIDFKRDIKSFRWYWKWDFFKGKFLVDKIDEYSTQLGIDIHRPPSLVEV